MGSDREVVMTNLVVVFLITAMLVAIPVGIVSAIAISISMKETQRMQEERESKWRGGAR